jgi:hypothetical protein
MSDISFESYNPFTQYSAVKEIWTYLLKKCPHTYFLSSGWTETWIKNLPTDCNLSLVVGFRNKLPVIAFFLGSKIASRHKFMTFRELSLNQTLIPDIDRIWVEYNAILIDPELKITLDSLLNLSLIEPWDEFRMVRFSSNYKTNLIINSDPNSSYILKSNRLKSYYVDLEKVRRNNYDYLAIISPKQRYQIRRSIKEYEKMGKIEIRSAENAEEALKILDELSEMHQKRWSARGLHGTMSSRYALDFHRDLVSRRFEHGEIQLLKVTAGSHVLGCLYCFLYQRDVSGYMCGFNYLDRNVYSPGAVCHYYAIVHNAMKGFNSYDFLEGEDSYRERLSTDINMMETIVIRRKNIKYTIEQCIMRLRELYKRKYPAIRVVMHILPL